MRRVVRGLLKEIGFERRRGAENGAVALAMLKAVEVRLRHQRHPDAQHERLRAAHGDASRRSLKQPARPGRGRRPAGEPRVLSAPVGSAARATGGVHRNGRVPPSFRSSFPPPRNNDDAPWWRLVMADQNAQDRNLPASQRKLEKARDEGQVARSRDLGHFAAIAAGGAVLVALRAAAAAG